MKPGNRAYATGYLPVLCGDSFYRRAVSALLVSLLCIIALATYAAPLDGHHDSFGTGIFAAFDKDETSERLEGKGKPGYPGLDAAGSAQQTPGLQHLTAPLERVVALWQFRPQDDALPPQLLQRPPPGR